MARGARSMLPSPGMSRWCCWPAPSAGAPHPSQAHTGGSTPLVNVSGPSGSGNRSSHARQDKEEHAAQHTAAASLEEPQTGLACWDREGRAVPCGTTTFHPSTAAWSHVCMWPHRSAVTKQQISSNMFSLVDGQAAACAHKHQTVVYTLPCPETRLVGSKLKLAPYTALMLDITYTNAPISDITISGGIVVCSGEGCSVTFTNVAFHHCTLVCLAGAQVAVDQCLFDAEMEGPSTGVSVVADGAGTRVVVQGGSIKGGYIGGLVQSGAHLLGTDVAISSVSAAAMKATGESSSLSLTKCHVHDFCPVYKEQKLGVGVVVTQECQAELVSCDIDVSTAAWTGMEVSARATATVTDCSFRASLAGGLTSIGSGSCVNAVRCVFYFNASSGAAAVKNGRLIAETCKSAGNGSNGFSAQVQGYVQLTDCSSADDNIGVSAFSGGELTGDNVIVQGSKEDGFEAWGGTMVLRRCHAECSRDSGMHVSGSGSCLDASDCQLVKNGQAGALADEGGSLVARGCLTSHNQKAGYIVDGVGSDARITECSSMHDLRTGCVVRQSARLHADHVHVEAAEQECFFVNTGATMVLRQCSATTSLAVSGVIASGAGSWLEAHNCTFARSRQSGVHVCKGASALCVNCKAQENKNQGYNVHGPGTMLQLSKSSSERDGNGCKVWAGGKVTAHHFHIHSPTSAGFGVQSGSSMYLSECQVERAKEGVFVGGSRKVCLARFVGGSRKVNTQPLLRSRLDAQKCTFLNCEKGMFASACVIVAGLCSTVGSTVAGYAAQREGGSITLTACTSSGDEFGCIAKEHARLTAHSMCVEGSIAADTAVADGGVVEMLASSTCGGDSNSSPAQPAVEAPELFDNRSAPFSSRARQGAATAGVSAAGEACIVCFSSKKTVGFLHRGTVHLCACTACAEKWYQKHSTCPMCNVKAEALVPVFS